MAVKVIFVKNECLSQFTNGNTFSLNSSDTTKVVQGNVLERQRVQSTIDVGVFVDMPKDSWYLVIDPNDNLKGFIKVEGLDWFNEGFRIGYQCNFKYKDNLIQDQLMGFIVNKIDGEYIFFDLSGVISGSVNNGQVGTVHYAGFYEFLDFSYGFNSNEEGFSSLNIYTKSNQRIIFENINLLGGIEEGYLPDPNNKAWITSEFAQAEFIGFVQDENIYFPDDTFKRYVIEIEYVIPPFIFDGDINKLKNKVVPDEFKGYNTVNYNFECKFQRSLGETNTEISKIVNDEKSNIGWLGESLNGGSDPFTISELLYVNESDNTEVNNLQASERTIVSFFIDNDNNDFTTDSVVIMGHIKIPTEEEYSNSQKYSWTTIWVLDQNRNVVNGSASSAFNIKDLQVTLVNSGRLRVDFVNELGSFRKLFISDLDDYLLFCHVEGGAAKNQGTKRVCKVVDVNQYSVNSDIEGLITIDYNRFYNNPIVFDPLVKSGFSDLIAWNESGAMYDFRFSLNLLKAPKIQTINFVIGAYNPITKKFFEIQNTGFIYNEVIVSDKQIINLDDNRGYNLDDQNQFNRIFLKNDGEGIDTVFYRGQIGFKFNWQHWLSLPGADTIFYNDQEDNNGINQKTSNYSLKNDYTIRCWVDIAVLAEGVSTDYRLLSPQLIISDYEQEPLLNNNWDSCLIETFNSEGQNINSNILENEDTKVRCVLVPNIPIQDSSIYWGILRIEPTFQPGFNIFELNTEVDPISNNLLTPVVGESRLKIYLDSGNLILEGMVKGSLLSSGVNYSLSCECDLKEPKEQPRDFSNDFS